ncbi:MAG TPA: bifunctional proline dehydrogenase/L-glutamate gamma-semialdehyde dehydrogenase, partial [Gammaproteobacteria bacterium]|nr:bifunctional proline dehydrogenase/L-glutamate gamma-semialdehyde dehydrogenase [Gammaproteobacteria bacterium]
MNIKERDSDATGYQSLDILRRKIDDAYLQDEAECLAGLLELANSDLVTAHNIEFRARDLVDHVRDNIKKQDSIEAFLREYSLSSEEGVVLMCLAESLLRIPDNGTADRLIRDKIAPAEWHKHKGVSRSLFVNASTWGLMLTGNLVNVGRSSSENLSVFSNLLSRVGEPVIRTVLRQAMKLMGAQYVMGSDIESACSRSIKSFHANTRFSFDMLGEAALSNKDAEAYYVAYQQAIRYLSEHRNATDTLFESASISIKLSALHPRYEFSQKARIMDELIPRVQALAELACAGQVALTLDAEEADRLDLSLDVFQAIKLTKNIKPWDGFGLAVQAYQKRAYPVLMYLCELASLCQSKIPVRLVKGAYWDTEIKRAQEAGLESYPVFTRKPSTDVSYLACAKYLIQHCDTFFPQFATHNAHTLAAILEFAKNEKQIEFQRLHGMGESLYSSIIEQIPCRVYAPVGSYKDL